MRLIRVFRILKLGRYVQAGDMIWQALAASRQKIAVFLMAVLSLVVVIGTLMYLIEGEEAGFTSIPTSVYWAIVTMTTVGYGDIAPQTVPGQMLASVVMILGYGIIAVPTGIMDRRDWPGARGRPAHLPGLRPAWARCRCRLLQGVRRTAEIADVVLVSVSGWHVG